MSNYILNDKNIKKIKLKDYVLIEISLHSKLLRDHYKCHSKHNRLIIVPTLGGKDSIGRNTYQIIIISSIFNTKISARKHNFVHITLT